MPKVTRAKKENTTVTLRDIATALGLSVSTVSAALQKRLDISTVTRQRVLKKAQEMNYQPNWLARALVTRRTQVLGVVVPDLSRSFFTEVSKGIDSVSSAAGYHLVICNTGEDEVREQESSRTAIRTDRPQAARKTQGNPYRTQAYRARINLAICYATSRAKTPAGEVCFCGRVLGTFTSPGAVRCSPRR